MLKRNSFLQRFKLPALALTLTAFSPAAAQHAFVVDNTNNGGAGSLRRAIEKSNAHWHPGNVDTIRFNIPGTGPFTISPTSPLPTVTRPVFIDGLSQPGASNSNWPPTLMIELDGTNAGASNGLHITADSCTIRGLVVNRFQQNGILVQGANNYSGYSYTIACNFIGTDVTGSIDLGNQGDGINLLGSNYIEIGGTGVQARNLISGNDGAGIEIGLSSSGYILGNFIGTEVTGASALGNGQDGVFLRETATIQIGGSEEGARNVISGNLANGIRI